MRKALIAQGQGYYGVSFFTTDLSWEKLILTLLKEPMHINTRGDEIDLDYPPDTGILIKNFGGNPQESVVTLYDSGHSGIDCHILNHLCNLLKNPYVTNGAMECRFLARKDVGKLVKKYKLDLKVIKDAAKAWSKIHKPCY